MKADDTWETSRHWTRSERVGDGATLRSGDVRWVLVAAGYRERHPTTWERLMLALERRLWHRFMAARITD